MANYSLYAVARGYNRETNETVTNIICNNWDEAKKYVVGIENARYKGFMTETEANAWLAKVMTEEVLPVGVKTKVHTDEIEEVCNKIGISRKALDTKLESMFLEMLKLGGKL